MQVRKACAVGGYFGCSSIARTAACSGRPIQSVARRNTCIRETSVAVGISVKCRETMQGRKGLRPHPASQRQAESGYQRGQEEQIDNAPFHRLILLGLLASISVY